MTDVARSQTIASKTDLYRVAAGGRHRVSQAHTARTTPATLSVVVAAYNEEAVIGEFHSRLKAVLTSIPYDHEIIVVDDGSVDGTVERLSALRNQDGRLRLLELSRNFGKEAAISAGIAHARGDAIILMDADLEHPPEVLPELLARWEAGAEVVIGVRNPRRREGIIRRASSRAFAHLMNAISEVSAPVRATDFRLIDRIVADEFDKLVEQKRLARSLIDWLGFRRAYVPFDAGLRKGKSRYGHRQLVASALAAIVAHSRVPLYVAGYLGGATILLSLLMGGFVLVEQIVLRDPIRMAVSGTAMLSILTLFLDGLLLSCLGLMGLYVGTIREEIAGRPLYIVRPTRSRAAVKAIVIDARAAVD